MQSTIPITTTPFQPTVPGQQVTITIATNVVPQQDVRSTDHNSTLFLGAGRSGPAQES